MSLPTEMDIRTALVRVKSCASDDVESEVLEFKGYETERALHNARDLAEEISALANKAGGVVVVGVKSGNDVSTGDWPAQRQGIANIDVLTAQERIIGKIQPKFALRVRSFYFEGKRFAVIDIPYRSDTLVSTTSGKTCIRDGRSSRPMTPEEIERAVKSLSTYDWSGEELDVDFMDVLDMVALDQAVSDFTERRSLEAKPDASSYLESVGATRNGRLTFGGLLFLGTQEAIRRCLGDYEYRFSWKKPHGELVVNNVWADNLWNGLIRARAHFDSCNKVAKFESRGREFDVPLLDSIAFHEAYLNALVHRDYSSDGMVAVNFTGQQLVITSPGPFYGGITAENIARHEPRHRNKSLARILMSHSFVDRAGMGVARMGIRSLMYGRAFPVFRETSDSVEVTMQAEFLRPPIAVLTLESVCAAKTRSTASGD